MTKKQTPKKSFWDSAGVKIGVVSGAIGIVLSLISVASAFKSNPLEKQQADLKLRETEANIKEKEIKIKEAEFNFNEYEPRIEVGYIFDESGAGFQSQYSKSKNNNILFFADYPVAENEISSNMQLNQAPSSDHMGTYIAYLVLQNSGKIAATEIEIETSRCLLKTFVTVKERINDSILDYRDVIRSKAASEKKVNLKMPFSLETGNGVLIPIFISETKRFIPYNKWNVISRVVYLPDSLKCKSPISGKVLKIAIRKMTAPLKLFDGIYGRG